MVNKVMLIGRVGKDPEIRELTDSKFGNFSLATSEVYTSNGEKKEVTQWHNVQVYGRQADFCDQYVRKGDLLYVEGKVEYRHYENKEGVKVYVTEVKAMQVRKLLWEKKEEDQTEDDPF